MASICLGLNVLRLCWCQNQQVIQLNWADTPQGLYSLSGMTSYLLTARSIQVSELRDSSFKLFNRSEIWQTFRQHRCRDACQISERYDHFNTHSRGFETSRGWRLTHYNDVIMNTIASQITSLTVVYSTVHSRSKKTPKLRVTGLCVGNSPGPVNSPHKGPVTRKMFPFDDVIMYSVNRGPVSVIKFNGLSGDRGE